MVVEYEALPDTYCSGMSVLRNVVMLETARRADIVIRNITEAFWQAGRH